MTQANKTDSEVYQEIQSGNLSSLGIIYDRYGAIVYRLALKMLGNTTDAEDLTQEVFLTFSKGVNYNPDRGSMMVFLLTITRNRAINRLRRNKSQQELIQKWEHNMSNNSKNPVEQVTLDELQQRVIAALQELPDNQRQVLEMAYYNGLSQSEITETLQIPLGTVKTRTRQALLKLRKLLQDLVDC